MTRVLRSPTACSSARTTVGGPPTTHPIELSDECTIKVISCVAPRSVRSCRRRLSVLGDPSILFIAVLESLHTDRSCVPVPSGEYRTDQPESDTRVDERDEHRDLLQRRGGHDLLTG